MQLRSDGGATLAFQRAPTTSLLSGRAEHPQQAHLDFDIHDLDTGEQQVIALGARKTAWQPDPRRFRVFLDPRVPRAGRLSDYGRLMLDHLSIRLRDPPVEVGTQRGAGPARRRPGDGFWRGNRIRCEGAADVLVGPAHHRRTEPQ